MLYFEYIPKIVLTAVPFTQANGFLTATYKARRPVLAKAYKAEIEEVYSSKVEWIH